MHRANNTSNQLLRDKNDAVYGVVLGAEYTPDHEKGISPLHRQLSIDGTGAFTSNTISTDVSERIHSGDFTSARFKDRQLVNDVGQFLTTSSEVADCPSLLLSRRDDETIVTGAFNESNFAVGIYGEKASEIAQTLQDGFAKGDIAVWMRPSASTYGRGALSIARASQVPSNWRKSYDELVIERAEVARLASESGIAERISVARGGENRGRLGYFALTPVRPVKDRLTSYPVMFLLNPMDQRESATGYFTVEELDLWIAGKGPVVENSRGAKARWLGLPVV